MEALLSTALDSKVRSVRAAVIEDAIQQLCEGQYSVIDYQSVIERCQSYHVANRVVTVLLKYLNRIGAGDKESIVPSDEELVAVVKILTGIFAHYGSLINRIDKCLTNKELWWKLAECAFGLLDGAKGASCYSLVALIYSSDINHSIDHGALVEHFLSSFVSRFTANRRSEMDELQVLKTFFTSSATQDIVNPVIIPKLMSKAVSQPSAVTSALNDILPLVFAQSHQCVNHENLEKLVQFAIKRSSPDLVAMLFPCDPKFVIESVLDAKTYALLNKEKMNLIDSHGVDLEKVDVAISDILSKFKKEKSTDDVLAVLLTLSSNAPANIMNLCKNHLVGETLRVLLVLVQTEVSFGCDEDKELQVVLSKVASAKKLGIDITVLFSFLTQTYSDKLAGIDLQNSFCHLVPRILAALSSLSDEQCALLVKLSICGDNLTRKNGLATMEKFSPKYGNKFLLELKKLVTEGLHRLHVGSVRICANHILNLYSKSVCNSDLLKMMTFGYLKPCTNEKVSEILLALEDLELFAKDLLDYSDNRNLTTPILLTLLYLDHEALEPVSRQLSNKVKELTKEISLLTEDDWEQVNMPSSLLYRNKVDLDNSTTSGPTKKHLSADEQWEEEIRREISSKGNIKNDRLSPDEEVALAKQIQRRCEVRKLLNQISVTCSFISTLFSDGEVMCRFLQPYQFVEKLVGLYRIIPSSLFIAVKSTPDEIELINLKTKCYTCLSSLGNCIHEYKVNPAELLTHALLLASDVSDSTNKNQMQRVLDVLLQLVHADVHFEAGSVYIISIMCSYVLNNDNLSMHDADIILDFLQIQGETHLSVRLVNSILKFSGRGLFVEKCISILTKIDASLGSADQIHALCVGAQEESESRRLVALRTLAKIYQENSTLVTNNNEIVKLAWINSHDNNEGIASASIEILFVANVATGLPDDTFALLTHENLTVRLNATAAYAHSLQRNNVVKGVDSLFTLFVSNSPSEGDNSDKSKALIIAPEAKPVKKTVVKKKVTKTSNIGGIGSIGQPITRKKKVSSQLVKDALKPKAVKKVDKSDLILGSKTNRESEDSSSKQLARKSVLSCIAQLPTYSVDVDVLKLIQFLTSWAICDPHGECRSLGCKTLSDIVGHYTNDKNSDEVMTLVKDILSTGKATDTGSYDKSPPNNIQAADYRKEGTVLALGACAIHFNDIQDITSILDQLIATLTTPSEEVQNSIALTIVQLVKKVKDADVVERMVKSCLDKSLDPSQNLATKIGMAYGVAAIVKGKGIITLKKYGVITALQAACNEGGEREGALYVIQQLDVFLKLLFEPYVLQLLPSIISASADSSSYVREAAAGCIKVIMSNLSNHGVKLVLPVILGNFGDSSDSSDENKDDWRAKVASLTILGSVGSISPKFVGQYLPKVIPILIAQHGSTNNKVKEAATNALNAIVSTIQNPEISSLSGKILDALVDGSGEKRLYVLEGLIAKNFVHAIDTPSVSITMPIISRSLRASSPSTHKRLACLILATFCEILEDPSGMSGYTEELVELLIGVLLSGQSQVRGVAAKAMGSMVRHLSSSSSVLEGLLDTLQTKLISNSITSIERSGISSGYAQVLFSKYYQDFDQLYTHVSNILLPVLSTSNVDAHEGVLWVFVYLPTTMSSSVYSPLIESTLPPIIGELSLEKQAINETVMRAVRVLISTQEVGLLLPSILDGCLRLCDNTRGICIELLGDLLYKLAGSIEVVEKAEANLSQALMPDTRREVLSVLYFARCDSSCSNVRNQALNVWKNIVSNTPKTLRLIMPELTSHITRSLASDDADAQQTAGRCLAELSSKLGESILKQVLPLFEEQLLRSSDLNIHRGVCIGLNEVISNLAKENFSSNLSRLVTINRIALCSDDASVQQLAAECFQSLYSQMGTDVLDTIVPNLLAQISNPNTHGRAINGLTQILAIRSVSRELLPYLIPRLLSSPVTKENLGVLSSIIGVTGEMLHLYLHTLIPALIRELVDSNEEIEHSIRDCLRSLFKSVHNVSNLIGEIVSKCDDDDVFWRVESCWMIGAFTDERKEDTDFYDDIPVFFRELIHRLNDDNEKVIKAANEALLCITKHVPAEELVKSIEYIRNLIATVVSEARRRKGGVGDGEFFMPGFNVSKGLEPLWPVYQRGILYGDASIREVSATGLGEIITLTTNKFFAGPLVIKMTGPLLRVVGDRNPSSVKIAIVKTLGIILTKGGPALRAFVPQFQTTFVKALSDPSRHVRTEATSALGLLVPLSTRVDPLIKELVSGSLGKSASVAGVEGKGLIVVQCTMLNALAIVLEYGGAKAKLPDTVPSASAAAEEILSGGDGVDDDLKEAAEKVLQITSSLIT